MTTDNIVCGKTAEDCRLSLFQDSVFAGDLEDSQFTSGGILCTFGSRTFVRIDLQEANVSV